MVMPDAAEILARIGHALADPVRRRILLSLRVWPSTAAELADELGETPSSMAGHLACLRRCGLVVVEPYGELEVFELTDRHLDHALGDLIALTRATDCGGTCDDGVRGEECE